MKNNLKKIALFIGFLIYLILLYELLFDREIAADVPVSDYAVGATNIIPFYSIRNFIHAYLNGRRTLQYVLLNIFGNIAIFIPFPMFLESLWRVFRKKRCLLPISFAILIGVELLQLVTLRGSFDVDDIILNFLGILLGHALFVVIRKQIR